MGMKQIQIVSVLTLSVCLSVSLAYVMGPDNRIEVSDAQSGVAAIRQTGMVRIHAEEFVSGLLTGANCDVVISAGHAAIYWQDLARKGWQKGEIRGQGRFRFNLDPGAGGEWQTMNLVASGYQQAENIGKDEHDWSIFRTLKPVTTSCKTLRVMQGTRTCKSDLLMPGFHFDRPDTKLLANACRVKQHTDRGIIVHDCDSKDGSSGAPLFCQDNDKLSLLAINISGLTRQDYYDAGVYGKSGRTFHDRQHKNFAIFVGGEFYRALSKEVEASVKRRAAITGAAHFSYAQE